MLQKIRSTNAKQLKDFKNRTEIYFRNEAELLFRFVCVMQSFGLLSIKLKEVDEQTMVHVVARFRLMFSKI